MLKPLIITVAFLCAGGFLRAQDAAVLPAVETAAALQAAPAGVPAGESATIALQPDKEPWYKNPRYYIGIHTGVDLGGAIPYPFSAMGPGAKMNAVPRLAPELGASLTTWPTDRFSISLEATWKQLSIDAKAWVAGQRFRDVNEPSRVLEFRGTVDVGMSFSMLEIPLYAGYSFGSRGNNRMILGLFYSQVFRGRFSSSPIKGELRNVNEPDEPPSMVTPDEPYTQNFDSDLDNWDWGMLIGYEWKVIERVHLGARISMGFKDIFKPDNKYLTYKMLHMRGTLVLSYAIIRHNR